jgi:hypothetical protein
VDVRDEYFASMALAVLARIKADGWSILPPRCKSLDPAGLSEPSDMTQATAEDDLRSSIRFAMQTFRHKPPRSRHLDEWERFYSWVALEVVRQIRATGWELSERALQKLPGIGGPSAFPPKTSEGD